jgi:polysaccharide chain length determinant protein (PEP-CTERM system associated)
MVNERPATDNLKLLILEHLVLVWKRRWLALAVAWVACIAGWAGVMLIPQRFESNARAFIDVNGLLTPLLRGLIVNTTPAESESYLRQTLLSRPNLDQVIVIANLVPPNANEIRREELIDELGRDIKVTTEGDNLVSISYADQKPLVARNVVDALLTIFAEKAATSSRAEMEKARQFLTSQIAQYGGQLRKAEVKRAEFRKKFAPFFIDSNVARPELMEQQLKQLSQQYEDAITSRNALAAELKQVPALLNVAAAPSVADNGQIVAASPEVRLAQAQRHLADLRLLYTEKHPDVTQAEHTVKDLQGEISVKKGTGGGAGKTQVPNPTYEALRLKFVDAQTIIPTLKGRVDRATQDYARVKALSDQLPAIQAKSQDIDRDYDVLKLQYDELVKRRESANLSQAADERADRTQFRIVDPPQIPLSPSFPNRVLLLSLTTLAGLVLGIATPILLARLNPIYGSATRLRGFGLPVIGALTFAPRLTSTSARDRLVSAGFAAAAILLIVAYAGITAVATGLPRSL